MSFLRKGDAQRRVAARRDAKKNAPVSLLGDLTPEILLLVFSHLSTAKELSVLSRINRRLGSIADDFELWHRVFCNILGAADEKSVEKSFADLSSEEREKNWKLLCMNKMQKRSSKLLGSFLRKYKKEVTLGGKLPNLQRIEKSLDLRFDVKINGESIRCAWKQPKRDFHSVLLKCIPLGLEFSSRESISVEVWAFSKTLMKSKQVLFHQSVSSSSSSSSSSGSGGSVQWRSLGEADPLCLFEDAANQNALFGVMDGECAFVVVLMTHLAIVQAFLQDVHPPHRVIPDDVDTTYGLHGYSVQVALRNTAKLFWDETYFDLHALKKGDSYCSPTGPCLGSDAVEAEFVMAKFDPTRATQFRGDPTFPWNTGLFSGSVPDTMVLQFILWDEHKQPVWSFCKTVKLTDVDEVGLLDFGQRTEDKDVRSVTVQNGVSGIGDVQIKLMVLPSEKCSRIVEATMRLQLSFIDRMFATQYAANSTNSS